MSTDKATTTSRVTTCQVGGGEVCRDKPRGMNFYPGEKPKSILPGKQADRNKNIFTFGRYGCEKI